MSTDIAVLTKDLPTLEYFRGRFNKLGSNGIEPAAVVKAYKILCDGKIPIVVKRDKEIVEVSPLEARELLTKNMQQNWELVDIVIGRALRQMILDLPSIEIIEDNLGHNLEYRENQ